MVRLYDKERILRLLTYKGILLRFKSMGFIRVFSDNIAEALDISSSLVRKDFGIFGISGNQKGGYHIDDILGKIDGILGTAEIQKVILVGVGRIGQALIHYKGFQNDGIRIIAGFDIDPKMINEKAEVPVYQVDKLSDFVKKQKIKIAIMAVPELMALPTFEMLKTADIKGILNFTPAKIKSSSGIIINHMNIEHELANLIYFVNQDIMQVQSVISKISN
jgi:redox-sensing transcriptional repressor